MGFIIAGIDVPGKCTTKDHIENRIPSEGCMISITEKQYQDMIDASTAFCASDVIYDLTPNNRTDGLINIA